MKKFILFILIILCCLRTSAQDIDYYEELVSTQKNSFDKLVAIDSVLSKSFRTDTDTFVTYSIMYIEMAKELDSINLAAKKAMNLQYPLTTYKNDPIKSIKIIDGVLAHKYKITDSFLLGGLYLKRGGANYKLDQKQAVEDYTAAIENFGDKDSVYIADAHLFSGQVYSNMGKFVPAGESYNKAYKIFEALNDQEYMFYAKQGIVVMFSMNGFYEKAYEERQKLFETLKGFKNQQYLISEYYNQAFDYEKTGNYKKMLFYLDKANQALETHKTINNYLQNKILINSKYAGYYAEKGITEKSKTYLSKIDTLIPNVSNDYIVLSAYNGAKAKYLKSINKHREALEFANKKLENTSKIGLEDGIMESHLLLSSIHEKIGNYKESLSHKESYITLKDSIYNRGTANALAYYQTLYETEKKEKELLETTANIRLLEKDNESFKKLIAFISVGVLLLFGVFLLFRNQKELKSNKIRQERFSQKLIVSQEEERKRISKDLHDSLGQQLLLIKNKIVPLKDEETKKMVDDAIDEVRTISRDLHPFQLQEMGITRAIEHTLTKIDENTTIFISSEIENIDNLFTPEQEVNIYRIVQESLNNIIKHAKAEASKVSVKKFSKNIIISVKDNGVGFDFSEKYQDIKSLGLKTLLERTKVLDGQMRVFSRKNTGTTLEFQFPIA